MRNGNQINAGKNALEKSLTNQRSYRDNQLLAFEMFDDASKVADLAVFAGGVSRNILLVSVAEGASIACTTMKYVVSPDKHVSHVIVNDYLPFQYQSTEAH